MELNPCPFCGGEAELKECDALFSVECKECGATSYESRDKHSVIEKWNDRGGGLMPCPFCGGKAIIYRADEYFVVSCRTCGTSVSRKSELDVVDAWDRRRP